MRNAEWRKKIRKEELRGRPPSLITACQGCQPPRIDDSACDPSAVSFPSPNSVSSRSPFANMETDLSLWRSWRKHQLVDSVENDLKLTRDLPTARLPHHATNAVYPAASPHAVLSVVFVFERGKLAGKFRIREEHLAQAHKCAHDGDVDCTARELRSTLESIATPCAVKA